MFKKAFLAAFAALALGSAAEAQTNVQLFYDFGKDRQYLTTTFEMFKGDKFGDTFFFIDHYYATSAQRKAGTASAINGSYFEIERGINFWQDTDWKDFSLHVEYNGSTWGAGIFCFGAKYLFHSADFSKTLQVALMYDQHIGVGYAKVPVKFSGVWGLNNLFGVNGLIFKGFVDVWGNGDTVSVLSEPQIWMNLGSLFDGHLDVGGEIELSYNFAGHAGFMCNPCAGLRWSF